MRIARRRPPLGEANDARCFALSRARDPRGSVSRLRPSGRHSSRPARPRAPGVGQRQEPVPSPAFETKSTAHPTASQCRGGAPWPPRTTGRAIGAEVRHSAANRRGLRPIRGASRVGWRRVRRGRRGADFAGSLGCEGSSALLLIGTGAARGGPGHGDVNGSSGGGLNRSCTPPDCAPQPAHDFARGRGREVRRHRGVETGAADHGRLARGA